MCFRLMNNEEELLPDRFDYIPLAQERALELTYDREVTEPMILLECGRMRVGDEHNNDEWEPTRAFAIVQQASSRCVELSSKCGMLQARVEQLERELAALRKKGK